MDSAYWTEGGYVIIRRSNIHDLVLAVRKWIEEGWLPQGGLVIWKPEDSRRQPAIFAQAMVRGESDAE